MAYRLGIDLGTSSIGAAAYRIDENRRPVELVFADSYIFGEPVNPKDYTTLNSKRRAARLIRRQTARTALTFPASLNRSNLDDGPTVLHFAPPNTH